MKFIKLFKCGEGCVIPDDDNYLMVLATDIDANGEWVPNGIRSFKTWAELKDALKELVATKGPKVVRASVHFQQLAGELGLTPLVSEWRTSF